MIQWVKCRYNYRQVPRQVNIVKAKDARRLKRFWWAVKDLNSWNIQQWMMHVAIANLPILSYIPFGEGKWVAAYLWKTNEPTSHDCGAAENFASIGRWVVTFRSSTIFYIWKITISNLQLELNRLLYWSIQMHDAAASNTIIDKYS